MFAAQPGKMSEFGPGAKQRTPVSSPCGMPATGHFLPGIGRRCASSKKFTRDVKPYDEQVYQNSLRRRGSLLGGALSSATAVGWKAVAGFQKLSEKNA
jgi:hypothetical protein